MKSTQRRVQGRSIPTRRTIRCRCIHFRTGKRCGIYREWGRSGRPRQRRRSESL